MCICYGSQWDPKFSLWFGGGSSSDRKNWSATKNLALFQRKILKLQAFVRLIRPRGFVSRMFFRLVFIFIRFGRGPHKNVSAFTNCYTQKPSENILLARSSAASRCRSRLSLWSRGRTAHSSAVWTYPPDPPACRQRHLEQIAIEERFVTKLTFANNEDGAKTFFQLEWSSLVYSPAWVFSNPESCSREACARGVSIWNDARKNFKIL